MRHCSLAGERRHVSPKCFDSELILWWKALPKRKLFMDTSMAASYCIMSVVFCCLLFAGILLCLDFEDSLFTSFPSSQVHHLTHRCSEPETPWAEFVLSWHGEKCGQPRVRQTPKRSEFQLAKRGKTKKKNVLFGFSQCWKDGPPLIYQLLHAIICHG